MIFHIMPKISPSVVFSGIELVAANGSVTAESICIPLTSLSGISSAEAEPSTGDGAELIRVLLETANTNVNALADSVKPAELTITKTQSLAQQNVGQIRNIFAVNADIAYDSTVASIVPEA